MVRTVHIAMRQWGKEITQRFTGLDRADHPRNVLRLLSRLEALLDRGQMNRMPFVSGRTSHARLRQSAGVAADHER